MMYPGLHFQYHSDDCGNKEIIWAEIPQHQNHACLLACRHHHLQHDHHKHLVGTIPQYHHEQYCHYHSDHRHPEHYRPDHKRHAKEGADVERLACLHLQCDHHHHDHHHHYVHRQHAHERHEKEGEDVGTP